MGGQAVRGGKVTMAFAQSALLNPNLDELTGYIFLLVQL